MAKKFSPPLDPGIAAFVKTLSEAGVETYESCQGGNGHAVPEPMVRFHGGRAEGLRALAIALQHNLPVAYLRRQWEVNDGEVNGPTWEMVFTCLRG